MSQLLDLHELIQEEAPRPLWSRGLEMARNQQVSLDQKTDDEWTLRVKIPGAVVSPRVQLWPKDEDWFCDCKEKTDPCAHVVASVIAAHRNWIKEDSDPGSGSHLEYHFETKLNEIHWSRKIQFQSKKTILNCSIVQLTSGHQNDYGSIPTPAITQDDYKIDYLLKDLIRKPIPVTTFQKTLPYLRGKNVFLNNEKIEIQENPIKLELVIKKNTQGIILKPKQQLSKSSILIGGILDQGKLSPLTPLDLSSYEKNLFTHDETLIPNEQLPLFFSEYLNSLKKRFNLTDDQGVLPSFLSIPPEINLKLETLEETMELVVTPEIIYGSPPIAYIEKGKLLSINLNKIPIRDLLKERSLAQKVKEELHLQLGQSTRFQGRDAIDFKKKIKNWKTTGETQKSFEIDGPLFISSETNLFSDGNFDFSVKFHTRSGKSASIDSIVTAWEERHSYVPLNEKGFGTLENEWIEEWGPILKKIKQLKEENKKIPLPLAAQILSLKKESFEEKLDQIKDSKNVNLPHINAQLRPYQHEGALWLHRLKSWNLGALLADDMGLGKTLQVITTLEPKSLIVVPTSLLGTWEDQLKKFRPSLSTHIYHGNKRTFDLTKDVILTTYGLLRREIDLIRETQWKIVVLDESQAIKNPESQIAQCAHQIHADFKIAMSGTPIENKLQDLWSQFEFLNPGIFGTKNDFEENFVNPISQNSSIHLKQLQKLIQPFLLRRTKKEVAKELPPKIEQTHLLELSDYEKQGYDALFESSKTEILNAIEEKKPLFSILEKLLRLRQICCHPGLIDPNYVGSSSKVDHLIEQAEIAYYQRSSILIFSQWTSFLDQIQKSFKEKNIECLRIDGTTKNRSEIVEKFQTLGTPQILLMSLKAGGVGLTLTAADHVFLMDPWWNPAVEQQAMDRAHRIGQDKKVFVHRLIAKDSIEEKILLLQEGKKHLSEELISKNTNASVGLEDLKKLFL